jgi:hypothetical protein
LAPIGGLPENKRQRHGEARGMRRADELFKVAAGLALEAAAEAIGIVLERAALGRDRAFGRPIFHHLASQTPKSRSTSCGNGSTRPLIISRPSERNSSTVLASKRFNAGDATRRSSGEGYLLNFALPNFYFHVTTRTISSVTTDFPSADRISRLRPE